MYGQLRKINVILPILVRICPRVAHRAQMWIAGDAVNRGVPQKWRSDLCRSGMRAEWSGAQLRAREVSNL